MKDYAEPISALMKYFSDAIRYIFWVVGILLMIGAFFFYQDTQKFLVEAASTEGTVIQMVASKGGTDVSRQKFSSVSGETYAPIVQFRDFSGTVIEFKSNFGSKPPQYEIGELVEVLYRIDAPEQARIKSFLSLWGASLILGFMGSIFVVIGAFRMLLTPLRRMLCGS
ncbi:DUF3592 domain-containing protein [Acaryochloris marina NIES-2412]|uniref:DUF3592 domain-containing protein n=1 Tax=Acaryochloris marina TaxID=155978 RepID=UPI004059BD6E